jgi:hypothetical protein
VTSTAALAAGLLIATGIKMLIPYIRRPPALIVAACAFGGMSFTQLPLLVVLVGTTLLSIIITDETRMP